MIYDSDGKSVRNTQWIKIRVIGKLSYNPNRVAVREWCKTQPGNGKFYYHYASDHWWFQLEQDAIMFKLRWGKYVG